MRTKLLRKCRKKAKQNIGLVSNIFESLFIVPDKSRYNPIGFRVFEISDYDRFFRLHNISPDDKIVLYVKEYIRWYILQTARKSSTNKKLILRDDQGICKKIIANNEDKYKIFGTCR